MSIVLFEFETKFVALLDAATACECTGKVVQFVIREQDTLNLF